MASSVEAKAINIKSVAGKKIRIGKLMLFFIDSEWAIKNKSVVKTRISERVTKLWEAISILIS